MDQRDQARMAMEGKATTSSAAQTRASGVPSTAGSDSREARQLAGPALTFDLDQELARLRQEGDYGINGRNARTLTKENDLRLVLVAVKEGRAVGDDEADGALGLLVMEGAGRFESGSVERNLRAGELAVVAAGEPWHFAADEDSAFLLTIAFRPRF